MEFVVRSDRKNSTTKTNCDNNIDLKIATGIVGFKEKNQ